MKDKKLWLIRLFIILFSISISVAILPCGIINAHGLFGELTSQAVADDEDSSSYQESRVFENRKHIKGTNIYLPGKVLHMDGDTEYLETL